MEVTEEVDERRRRKKKGRRGESGMKGKRKGKERGGNGKGSRTRTHTRSLEIRPSTRETENPPEKFERKCADIFFFYLIRKENLEVRGMKHLKRDDQNILRARLAGRGGCKCADD